jgi:DNA polymerase alpha subunit A
VQLQIKEKVFKVLAKPIYGYLGYRYSQFQAKKLAALITKQGRFILDGTEEVIYGDTDSVMFDSRVSEANAKSEKLAISSAKGYNFLRLAINFIFAKMLLVEKKNDAALVWNNTTRIEAKDLIWSDVTGVI